jgi:hypothetical protein
VVGVLVRQRGSAPMSGSAKPSGDSVSEPADSSSEKVVVAPPVEEKPAPPSNPKVSDDERALRSVLRAAAKAEIQATRNLDAAPLARVYTGAALGSALANLQYLRTNGMYAVAELGGQSFDSFRVSPDRSRAEVQTTETWTVHFVSILNGACLGEWPTYQISHTFSLGRTGAGWMIDGLQHHNQPPQVQPCSE